jgi:L-threonylcarbamoyladenylate synthase
MPIGTNTQAAADLLRKGEVVAIPTETVYGLAANAYNEAAVLKIFQAKQRPAFDPLIVHVHSLDQVKEVVSFSELKRKDTRKEAEALMAKFWPGPLTLVLPKSDRVPDLVTSGLDTVAVRMPAHPMALELLRSLDFPLAAPSANPFGYVSPTTAQHVADQLGEKIPYILDGGPCTVGVESTIIGWESDAEQWVLYRPGGTKRIAILGSTGSIGTQALDVVREQPEPFERGVAHCGRNVDLLIKQALAFKFPNAVVIGDAGASSGRTPP